MSLETCACHGECTRHSRKKDCVVRSAYFFGVFVCVRRHAGFPDERQASGTQFARNVHFQDCANIEPRWRRQWKVSTVRTNDVY